MLSQDYLNTQKIISFVDYHVLSDTKDLRRAYNTMYDNLDKGASNKDRATVGFPGGTEPDLFRYDESTDMWWRRSKNPDFDNIYWAPFGIGDPWEQNRNILLRITCKSNSRITEGAFVRDNFGRVHVAHTGRLGGNHKGEKISIPKNHRIRRIKADDGREDLRDFYLISDIKTDKLATNLREYLEFVHKKKYKGQSRRGASKPPRTKTRKAGRRKTDQSARYALDTNPTHARKAIEILLDWYRNKKDGIFSEHVDSDVGSDSLPSGMRRGSYDHIMLITMTNTVNYGRDASDLWGAAYAAWEDRTARWIFHPKKVAKRTKRDLARTLGRYRLNRKTKRDVDYWRTVACSFADLFDGDPRNMFGKFGHDAERIVAAMKKEYGERFPSLAGSKGTGKIRSLWIRMLYQEANVRLKNLQRVDIPIDIHTARSTMTIGCLSGSFEGSFTRLARMAKQAWVDACEGTRYYPLELDEPLWMLSRYGCTNYADADVRCPVRHECRLEKHCTANVPSSKIRVRQNGTTTVRTRLPRKK